MRHEGQGNGKEEGGGLADVRNPPGVSEGRERMPAQETRLDQMMTDLM